MSDRSILIDVSRLVWRFWRGGLPTGIDRVCLAYVDHFRDRSRAVIQRGGFHIVLGERASQRLFDLFSREPLGFRLSFLALAISAVPAILRSISYRGATYINVGHTGLNEPSLGEWIARNELRAIFLVHDLIPLTHPEYCRPDEHEKHKQRMRTVLTSGAGVIGNSSATIQDLAKFAGESSLPMPAALAAWIAGPPISADISPKKFGRPHFVTVGTIEGRKNHRLLLRCWKSLIDDHGAATPLLVIIGQRGWEANEAIAMLDGDVDLKAHVIELGRTGDKELAEIIAGAKALLMPSFAEGFGLPVAEALQLGTPVIASNLPAFREFAGDIPTYLDPKDEPAWRSAIMEFASDCTEKRRQAEAMKSFDAPNWADHFERVEGWFASLE